MKQQSDEQKQTVHDRVRGRVVWVLVFISLLQIFYPISALPGKFFPMLYNFLYFGLVFAGLWLSDDRKTRYALWGFGLPIIITGFLFVWYPQPWTYIAASVSYTGFFIVVTTVLVRYVFDAKHVNRDVLLAAVTVYILLGAVFVPIYTLLENIAPNSFSGAGLRVGEIVYWQNFAYYSYVTLTTVGYGDILPVSMWARSLVGVEMVSGTMYLTIIMARLVGLYAADDVRVGE